MAMDADGDAAAVKGGTAGGTAAEVGLVGSNPPGASPSMWGTTACVRHAPTVCQQTSQTHFVRLVGRWVLT